MSKDISIVTAKVDIGLKIAAQKKAEELGIPISAVIKDALKDFVKSKKYVMEEQTPELAALVEEARAEYARGETLSFPAGEAAEGLRKWLDEHPED